MKKNVKFLLMASIIILVGVVATAIYHTNHHLKQEDKTEYRQETKKEKEKKIKNNDISHEEIMRIKDKLLVKQYEMYSTGEGIIQEETDRNGLVYSLLNGKKISRMIGDKKYIYNETKKIWEEDEPIKIDASKGLNKEKVYEIMGDISSYKNVVCNEYFEREHQDIEYIKLITEVKQYKHLKENIDNIVVFSINNGEKGIALVQANKKDYIFVKNKGKYQLTKLTIKEYRDTITKFKNVKRNIKQDNGVKKTDDLDKLRPREGFYEE